jgi:hypothetical protein
MTMSDNQQKFAGLIGKLLVWIYGHPGWGMTFGDANRPDGQGHEKNSLHYVRLAIDLNLFVDGVWKVSDCPEWQAIGAYWFTLDPECTWGGSFKTGSRGDLNHMSFGEGRAVTMPKPTVTA